MVVETEHMIDFSYSTSDLFDAISTESLYASRNIATATTGADPIDTFALTVDEHDFVTAALDVAFANLLSIITDKCDTAINLMNNGSYGFSVNLHEGYNPTRLTVIDTNVSDFLKNSVLTAWAKNQKLENELSVYGAAMIENIRHIADHLGTVARRAYRSSYTIEKTTDDGRIL